MSQAFDHIVQELDRISQQEKYALRELLDEKLAIANGTAQQSTRDVNADDDPLAGLRVSTGIIDLAEHFDEYRFGRRTP
jgi:hypothetical protein